jgi:hypothetical protein
MRKETKKKIIVPTDWGKAELIHHLIHQRSMSLSTFYFLVPLSALHGNFVPV